MLAQLRRPVLSLALTLLTGSVLGAAEFTLGLQLSAGAPLSDRGSVRTGDRHEEGEVIR